MVLPLTEEQQKIQKLFEKSTAFEEALVKLLSAVENWQLINKMAGATTSFDEEIAFAQNVLEQYKEEHFARVRDFVDNIILGPISSGASKLWYLVQNSGCYSVRCYSGRTLKQDIPIEDAMKSMDIIPEELKEKIKECLEINNTGICFTTYWNGKKAFYFSTYNGHISEDFETEEEAIKAMMERHH